MTQNRYGADPLPKQFSACRPASWGAAVLHRHRQLIDAALNALLSVGFSHIG
jgi:hypothetical protein